MHLCWQEIGAIVGGVYLLQILLIFGRGFVASYRQRRIARHEQD